MHYKFFSVPLNFLIPGAGLAYLGLTRAAFICQGLIYMLLAVLVLSRLILQPSAWIAFACTLLLLSFGSTFYGLTTPSTGISSRKRMLHLLGFSCAGALGLGLCLVYKASVLGIHVYFVPSASMTPTLNPGDFILLDTWAYTRQSPVAGDILVFQQDPEFAVVKRSANWPGTTQSIQHKQLYMLGDNPLLSMDSRRLGGIDLSKVQGKVILKLATWDASSSQVQWQLTPVR